MRTLSILTAVGVSVTVAATLAAMSGCTVEARPEHVHYAPQPQPVYQGTPVYQQPVYQAPPPPPPPPPPVVYRDPHAPVVIEEHHDQGFDRRPIFDALAHLRAADGQIVPNHLDPSKENLRAARDGLRRIPHDRQVDAALDRISAALDAADHSRPRIEQDHIREAIAILHKNFEGDRH